jgi:hypothetical protein
MFEFSSYFILFFFLCLIPSPPQNITRGWRPKANRGPHPPQFPPVQVAAPASIRLGAIRGLHLLPYSVCARVGASEGGIEEGPERLPGSPAPPPAFLLPRRFGPHSKVEDKK